MYLYDKQSNIKGRCTDMYLYDKQSNKKTLTTTKVTCTTSQVVVE